MCRNEMRNGMEFLEGAPCLMVVGIRRRLGNSCVCVYVFCCLLVNINNRKKVLFIFITNLCVRIFCKRRTVTPPAQPDPDTFIYVFVVCQTYYYYFIKSLLALRAYYYYYYGVTF